MLRKTVYSGVSPEFLVEVEVDAVIDAA